MKEGYLIKVTFCPKGQKNKITNRYRSLDAVLSDITMFFDGIDGKIHLSLEKDEQFQLKFEE